ncbi:hypothetical protein AB0442_35265 [Kitasatospora sp. NPDC085895]|uniref:hypothetical protein n=1 Tax=Kitasatospora sp. NPDC085895 TaxID=3155057 RepID=UPI00344DF0C6
MGKASRGKAQARLQRQEAQQRRDAEAAALRRAAALFGSDQQSPLTLVVDTPLGVAARRIAPALPRPNGVEPGIGAEEATHAAAATWGLPDFVFRAPIRKVGSGQRELGDRVVIVGDRAAAIQVKCRQGEQRDPAGERSWAQKNAAKAARQARGTIRNLRLEPARFTNSRGREIEVDGNSFTWLAIIVVDDDYLPSDTTVDLALGDLPGVALLRRDWDFLFNQLRSTHAVIGYLFRVAPLPPRALGEEPMRYYELAAADLAAAPSPGDGEWLGSGHEHRSTPLLPQAPVGSDARRAHLLLRIILEDIATGPLSDGIGEAARLQALADIDSLPVGFRTELGEKLQEMLADVASVKTIKWRMRRLLDSGMLQLIFGACSRELDDGIAAAAESYVQLRHHQFELAKGASDERVTLLVLLTPRSDGQRPFDSTMLRLTGRSSLTKEELALRVQLWDQ